MAVLGSIGNPAILAGGISASSPYARRESRRVPRDRRLRPAASSNGPLRTGRPASRLRTSAPAAPLPFRRDATRQPVRRPVRAAARAGSVPECRRRLLHRLRPSHRPGRRGRGRRRRARAHSARMAPTKPVPGITSRPWMPAAARQGPWTGQQSGGDDRDRPQPRVQAPASIDDGRRRKIAATTTTRASCGSDAALRRAAPRHAPRCSRHRARSIPTAFAISREVPAGKASDRQKDGGSVARHGGSAGFHAGRRGRPGRMSSP